MDTGLLGSASRMPTSTPPPGPKESLDQEHKKPAVPQLNIPSGPKSPSNTGLPASPRSGVFPRVNSPDGATVSPSATQSSGSGVDEPAKFAARDSTKTMAQPTPRNGNSNNLQIRIENPDAALLNGTFDFENRLSPRAETFNHDGLSVDSNGNKPGNAGDIEFRFSVASAGPQEEEEAAQKSDNRKSLAPVVIDGRRLSMGYRPLPPEGNPNDTAEERAMRIRSFYKEYFSVEESGQGAPPMPGKMPMPGPDEMPYIDERTGALMIPGARPFAEAPPRRAMTPPPRMPPRFGPDSRAGSAASHRPAPGPRSATSASGRPAPPKQRKPVEPPAPLQVLPTPSKMTEDAFAMPIMFAPPPRIHDEGDDLRGGLRPYSPTVTPHIPLVSSFDDLSVLPSPHMLRKSGHFTGLDFAPPRKFKNDDAISDAGSVHSQRSGVSALHANNIKTGAYRVSKIPTEVVPLKDQMAAELKPSWNMRDKM